MGSFLARDSKFCCVVPWATWLSLLYYGKVLCHAGKLYFSSPNEQRPQHSCLEQAALEDALVPFWIHDSVLKQNCEKQDHMNGLRTLYYWHDTGLMIALFQMQGQGDQSEKITLPQSSAHQSIYLLQNISLFLMFFLVSSDFSIGLLDTRPFSLLHCVQMHSHLPSALVVPWSLSWFYFRRQWWHLVDFLGYLKPSSQALNFSPWIFWWFSCKSYWQNYLCLWAPFCEKLWWLHVYYRLAWLTEEKHWFIAPPSS